MVIPEATRMHLCRNCVKWCSSRLSSMPKRGQLQVIVAMLRKWQSQNESYHQSLSWLQCDIGQGSHGMVGCQYISWIFNYVRPCPTNFIVGLTFCQITLKNYNAHWATGVIHLGCGSSSAWGDRVDKSLTSYCNQSRPPSISSAQVTNHYKLPSASPVLVSHGYEMADGVVVHGFMLAQTWK